MSVGIDYMAFTGKFLSIEKATSWAAQWFGSCSQAGGMLGYRRTYRGEGVTICYDGEPGMGIHVEVSGAGCAALVQHERWQGWRSWVDEVLAMGSVPTRMDLAFDDNTGTLDVDCMVDALEAEHYTSKFHGWSRRYGWNRKALQSNVLYLGAISSPSCICVYDKRVEQLAKGAEDPGAWVRVEMRFKAEQAVAAWAWLRANEELKGAAVLLRDAVQFKLPAEDTNRARWEVAPWWACFLGDCCAEVLKVVRTVKSLAQGVASFCKQHAATFCLLENAFDYFCGKGGFRKQVLEVGSRKTNKRHIERLARWLQEGAPLQPELDPFWEVA